VRGRSPPKRVGGVDVDARVLPVQGLDAALAEVLIERRRVALEAAFFSGSLESPRDAGKDVADSLGIAAATFRQRVRVGARRLFARFSPTTPTSPAAGSGPSSRTERTARDRGVRRCPEGV
jgi:hypothetical protein